MDTQNNAPVFKPNNSIQTGFPVLNKGWGAHRISPGGGELSYETDGDARRLA